jgi:hypothetical protein
MAVAAGPSLRTSQTSHSSSLYAGAGTRAFHKRRTAQRDANSSRLHITACISVPLWDALAVLARSHRIAQTLAALHPKRA